eukprot:COSAG02_NODE_567_length_20212_cov_18.927460_8_plen_176_part_00
MLVGAGSSRSTGTPVEAQPRYRLPRGCTESQKAAIEANPTGLLSRFGLCVLPTNTWQCFGKAFKHEENEWRRRGIDDRDRQTEATLGGLHSFATCYGKGNAQKHSDFKSIICQRVYTTFKLRDPNKEWWLDISCGGALSVVDSAVTWLLMHLAPTHARVCSGQEVRGNLLLRSVG